LWFDHPRYVPVRDKLIGALSRPSYHFRKLSPVVFLCGGAHSAARDTLRLYINRTRPTFRVFYAEKVWEAIAGMGHIDALQMENQLADLADIVVIVVESAGTFTELGAFSVSEPLRKKILPILDDIYKTHTTSFIATGPIRWIDATSDFAPSLYAPHIMILSAAKELDERLNRIKKRGTTVKDLNGSRMHVLFFLCDLISMIYPATLEMVALYMSRIAPALGMLDLDLHLLLALGTAMDLLQIRTIGGSSYFAPASLTLISRPYHHVPRVNFGSYRGEHAAVLQMIPSAKEVLLKIGALS
jgi:hypothetical protein